VGPIGAKQAAKSRQNAQEQAKRINNLTIRSHSPHLASGERPPTGQHGLTKGLPLPEGIAVALVVVRSRTRREKIGFVIPVKTDVFRFALY
jgi:hypothetical protein